MTMAVGLGYDCGSVNIQKAQKSNYGSGGRGSWRGRGEEMEQNAPSAADELFSFSRLGGIVAGCWQSPIARLVAHFNQFERI
jgi:hypothetical protein